MLNTIQPAPNRGTRRRCRHHRRIDPRRSRGDRSLKRSREVMASEAHVRRIRRLVLVVEDVRKHVLHVRAMRIVAGNAVKFFLWVNRIRLPKNRMPRNWMFGVGFLIVAQKAGVVHGIREAVRTASIRSVKGVTGGATHERAGMLNFSGHDRSVAGQAVFVGVSNAARRNTAKITRHLHMMHCIIALWQNCQDR